MTLKETLEELKDTNMERMMLGWRDKAGMLEKELEQEHTKHNLEVSKLQNQVDTLEKQQKAHNEIMSRSETVIAIQLDMLQYLSQVVALADEHKRAYKKWELALLHKRMK